MILLKSEIDSRIEKFYSLMNTQHPDWDIAVIFDRVNQYYFTGTYENSVLLFTKEGGAHYFVRKSYKRALIESQFPNIHPMNSFGDIPRIIGEGKHTNGYIETGKVPMGLFNMANKYLNIENVKSLDSLIAYQRSIKSEYEIKIIKEVGARQKDFLVNVIPTLLEEGMTELEFVNRCRYEMVRHGHQGIARLNTFQANTSSGEIAFGENSVYPTSFDGPGGAKGMYPAQPRMGDADRTLQKGDLIFVDAPYGMYGYHTDIAQVYMFKGKVNKQLKAAHEQCMKIEKAAGEMLKAGTVPSEIYKMALNLVDEKYKDSFMGSNGENVKFLGHGIGLCVDEPPVFAAKYNVPLEQNMVVAIEPKISFEGVGLVGVEDTYIVGKDGGICITGGGLKIIEVE